MEPHTANTQTNFPLFFWYGKRNFLNRIYEICCILKWLLVSFFPFFDEILSLSLSLCLSVSPENVKFTCSGREKSDVTWNEKKKKKKTEADM